MIAQLKKTILMLILLAVVINASAQQHLYDTTKKPRLISKQFTFTEGASVDKQGNVFFTDQPNNKIWEYSVDGKLSVFMEDAWHSNGTYFDSKGNLISCAESKDQLVAISPKGKIKVLVNDFRNAGNYSAVWDTKTANINSGIYRVVAVMDGNTTSTTVQVIK